MLDNWTILISLEMKTDHVLRVFHEFFIEKSNKLVDVSINKEFSGNHHFPSFSKRQTAIATYNTITSSGLYIQVLQRPAHHSVLTVQHASA